jgi:hypothetical protein
MPDDLVSLAGDERHPLSARHGRAEILDEARDELSVVAERSQMDGPNRVGVAVPLHTNVHEASVVCDSLLARFERPVVASRVRLTGRG